jgi:hypothetical protein
MAVYLLIMPFMQAFSGILVPIAIVSMFFLRAPDLVVMATFTPLLPTIASVAIEAVGLHEFGRVFQERVRLRDYTKLVVGTVPYQLVLAAAAVRATHREIVGVRTWEKTSHVGAHRPTALSDPQESVL